MTHGVDTDFLVAAEVIDHPFHEKADDLLRTLLDDGHDFALAPQTLAEFIHVVTDERRMPQPLSMAEAVNRAESWWLAEEVIRVFPAGRTVAGFTEWLRRHRLGRKRLLDTMLAATFKNAGVRKVITNNSKDYKILNCFDIVGFR